MKIYVGHSSGIDFRERLYRPLKESSLNQEHELVFPHEVSDEPFDSKQFLRDECDLFIAEVSRPSTGLGIELGWAETYDVPVIAVHRSGNDISSSLEKVVEIVMEYDRSEEIPELVSSFLG